jgi:hypothetical protein
MNKQKVFVKGGSVDEKLNSIETALRHISRRMSQKVIGMMPVSPVFEFVYAPGPGGILLRIIIPASGRITKMCVYVGRHGEGKNSTTLNAAVSRKGTLLGQDFIAKSAPLTLDVNIDVKAGDLLTLSAVGGAARDIWIGFLYEVGIENLSNQDFMLDQIESMIDSEQDDITAGNNST